MSAYARDRIGGEIMDSRDLEEVADEIRAEDEEDRDEDDVQLLAAIEELEQETSEWAYGAGFIRDDYFEEYARQFAEDIGAIDRDAAWPACHIDWAAAADSLRMDYTSVEFMGATYWTLS